MTEKIKIWEEIKKSRHSFSSWEEHEFSQDLFSQIYDDYISSYLKEIDSLKDQLKEKDEQIKKLQSIIDDVDDAYCFTTYCTGMRYEFDEQLKQKDAEIESLKLQNSKHIKAYKSLNRALLNGEHVDLAWIKDEIQLQADCETLTKSKHNLELMAKDAELEKRGALLKEVFDILNKYDSDKCQSCGISDECINCKLVCDQYTSKIHSFLKKMEQK